VSYLKNMLFLSTKMARQTRRRYIRKDGEKDKENYRGCTRKIHSSHPLCFSPKSLLDWQKLGCSKHPVLLQRFDEDRVFHVCENHPDVIGVRCAGEVRVDVFALP